MRYSFHIALVLLVMLVTGCGGAYRYDSRLAAADSLMHDLPDSALALIQAVNPASLTRECDRAYHDLLLTQARYRCYITATSDSDINRALNYYRRHDGEREKLTRAYIYKGAVMEELGHPDSAMLYYKHAEATAAPTDYFNLGYSKIRIAELYQQEYSQDSAAIIRLNEARRHFIQLKDSNFLIITLSKLGAITGTKSVDSSKYYFTEAIRLAKSYKPSLQYTEKSKLSGLYLSQDDYLSSNQLAMDVFNHGREDCMEWHFYYYAVISYVMLNKLDSAQFVLSQTPAPSDKVDSLLWYKAQAEIAKANHEYEAYADFTSFYKDLSSSILSTNNVKEITKSEFDYDVKQLENQKFSLLKLNNTYCFVIAIACFFLIILVYLLRFNYKNHEKEMMSIKNELELALQELNSYQQNQNSISELFAIRMSAINELYQDIRVKINDKGRAKRIIPLSSVFSSMDARNEILDIHPSDSFWEKLRLSVNGEYNNILSFIEKQFPNLSEKDIQLFCLLCANIPPQVIKLCMGYSNVRTVSNYRIKLINKKMGLDISFDDFIKSYMNDDFNSFSS